MLWFGPFPQPWLAPVGLVGEAMAILLTLLGLILNQPLWLLLAAALLGFLRWNWAPAKIFMGDVGSTTLGGAVALALMQAPSQPWALLSLTLPITADAIYTLSRRLIQGENIFTPHRTHLYQRLHQQGWTAPSITLSYLTYTLVIALLLQVGPLGPWMGVALTVGLIAVTEAYLQRRQGKGVGSREWGVGFSGSRSWPRPYLCLFRLSAPSIVSSIRPAPVALRPSSALRLLPCTFIWLFT